MLRRALGLGLSRRVASNSVILHLRRGEYFDTAEIASKCDLSEAYVGRMLRLAFLAPDIAESIAEGWQHSKEFRPLPNPANRPG